MRANIGRPGNQGLLANLNLIVVVLVSDLLKNFALSQVLNRFAAIQYLADVEENIVGLAKSEIERYEKELKILKAYVQDYEESTQRHLNGLKEGYVKSEEESFTGNEHVRKLKTIASNPLLVYRLSHRYATKFPRLLKLLLRKNPQAFQLRETLAYFANPEDAENEDIDVESYGEHFGKYHPYLSTNIDLEETLESLVILYDTHEPYVSPANFSSRFSPETTTPVIFNAEHALKFSLKAFYHGLYASAIDWVTFAEETIDKFRDYSVSKELVQYTRQFIIKTHNTEQTKPVESLATKTYLAMFNTSVPIDDPLYTIHDHTELKTRKGLLSSLYHEDPTSFVVQIFNESHLLVVYNDLCKGNNPKVLSYGASLKCYLSSKRHPFYILSPVKTEELSKFPRIYQFYDVINNNEIDAVIEDLKKRNLVPDLQRDFFPDVNGTREVPPFTSSSAIISVREMESLKVMRKKAHLLGLIDDMENGGKKDEEGSVLSTLRVTEYVAGRYSSPVKDFGNEEEFKAGDILSTIFVFVATAEDGGEIVFPVSEAVGRPIKGSMIHWETMYRDSAGLHDMWYGDCPVARGHKIVISASGVTRKKDNANMGCQGWTDPYDEGEGFLFGGWA